MPASAFSVPAVGHVCPQQVLESYPGPEEVPDSDMGSLQMAAPGEVVTVSPTPGWLCPYTKDTLNAVDRRLVRTQGKTAVCSRGENPGQTLPLPQREPAGQPAPHLPAPPPGCEATGSFSHAGCGMSFSGRRMSLGA